VSNDAVWSKEELFQSMPDIWFRNGDGTRMEFRCRGGVWRWKHVNDDGEVLAEGEGSP
jgi:hypothetical protein